MTACMPRARAASRAEQLTNWLALLTLVALGIVWPGGDAPRAGAVPAGAAPLRALQPASARPALPAGCGDRDP